MDDGGVLEDDDEAACNIEPEGDGPEIEHGQHEEGDREDEGGQRECVERFGQDGGGHGWQVVVVVAVKEIARVHLRRERERPRRSSCSKACARVMVMGQARDSFDVGYQAFPYLDKVFKAHKNRTMHLLYIPHSRST